MKNYTDMRDAIFEELYGIALKDKKVILLSADNGASVFKKFEENIPGQFYNVGISEQNAMSVAAGLASTGRHVFVVGLANFVTLRPFEQINVDIASMNVPVTILATGTGYFYSEDGPTHHMINNLAVMRTVPGFSIWIPSSFAMGSHLIHEAYETPGPGYLWFDRGPFSEQCGEHFSGDGACLVQPGSDALIVSTGIMVGEALRIARELKKESIDVGVLDLYRPKPLNRKVLVELLGSAKKIITLEEHTIMGGLGSIICEFLADAGLLVPVKMFGIPDSFQYAIGTREHLRSVDGIDAPGVAEKIKSWLRR